MKKMTVNNNYIFNLIYQVFTFGVVLITTPYISRVLGTNNIGIYSYTYSIVTYFILVGTLGISLYGQREIAYYQDDIQKRSKIFYEIVFFKILIMIISFIFYFLLFCKSGSYSFFYRIFILELLANGIDIIWFFQGLEDFKKVIIRNVCVKTVGIILILLFVKERNDLWIYILIFVLSNLIGNFSLWINLPKYIEKINFKSLNIVRHFKPTIMLFIPQIAIQIYTVLDKTMIGTITQNMAFVGIYQKAQELTKFGLAIVVAYGTVVFPRMANNYKTKNKEKLYECVRQSFQFLWIIGLPITFGFMAIAKNFIPWFLGAEFIDTINLLIVFSFIIIVVGLNNVVGMQYLIATNRQKEFSIYVTIGAVLNVIGNFLLIKPLGYYGAVLSSILAEVVILILEFRSMHDEVKHSFNIKLFLKCLLSSIAMALLIYIIGIQMSATIISTFIQVFVGFIVYFILLIILKEKLVINTIFKIVERLKKGAVKNDK